MIVSSGRKCYAFIPDSTDKTVRIIDTDTNALFNTITVTGTGNSLQGVAAEESGVYVYVADAGSTRLLQIDPLTMAISNTLMLDAKFPGQAQARSRGPGRQLRVYDQQRSLVGSRFGEIRGQHLRDRNQRQCYLRPSVWSKWNFQAGSPSRDWR